MGPITNDAPVGLGRICGEELYLTADRVSFHGARPSWEGERIASMRELVQPGWVIYDVGAECGDFSALYAKWGAGVVLVECQPLAWPSIRTHFEANELAPPLAVVVGFAAEDTGVPAEGVHWDRDRDLPALQARPGAWPPCSVGEVIPDVGFRHLAQQADSTPRISLDDLAEVSGFVPDGIVMDIEGAEYPALAGCQRLMAGAYGKRPLLWVSVHPVPMLEWYGARYADLLARVQDQGYDGRLLGRHGEDFWLFAPIGEEPWA